MEKKIEIQTENWCIMGQVLIIKSMHEFTTLGTVHYSQLDCTVYN